MSMSRERAQQMDCLQVQVVAGNEPGLLLLMDLQTQDLFEIRLGLDTEVTRRVDVT